MLGQSGPGKGSPVQSKPIVPTSHWAVASRGTVQSLLIGRSFDGDIFDITFTVKRDSATSSVGDLVPGTIQAHLKPGKEQEEAENEKLSTKAVLSLNDTNGSAELESLFSPTVCSALAA